MVIAVPGEAFADGTSSRDKDPCTFEARTKICSYFLMYDVLAADRKATLSLVIIGFESTPEIMKDRRTLLIGTLTIFSVKDAVEVVSTENDAERQPILRRMSVIRSEQVFEFLARLAM